MENPYLIAALIVELIIWWAAPKLPIKWIPLAGRFGLVIGSGAIAYLGVDSLRAPTYSLNLFMATALQCYVVGTAAWLAYKNSKPY